jgi:nucleoside-diphosphate-sugar epimerase
VKKVLVTGATGFVGRELCRHLSSNGWHVRAAIRATSNSELATGCEVIQIRDIGPDTNWTDAVAGMNAIVHLAARVHVMGANGNDELEVFRRINTAGTLALARESARAGVRRFIFLSTIKVNGERTVATPFSESDLPCPLDPYAISKLEAERGLDKLGQETGLNVVTLRPPLIYGPGVKGNLLRLMALVRLRVPLPLASIDNSRSLLGVSNLISAIELALTAPTPVSGTYLISDDRDLSTPELIKLIGAAMGVKPLMFRCPPGLLRAVGNIVGREDEVRRLLESLQVDCALLKQRLGWQPTVDVDAGIVAATQAYQRTISSNTRS